MYGDDSSDLDINDILDPIIEEFSIKIDVNLKSSFSADAPMSMARNSMQKIVKKSGTKEELTSYSNLKNNYLGRISSPMMTEKEEQDKRNSVRDEQTPE